VSQDSARLGRLARQSHALKEGHRWIAVKPPSGADDVIVPPMVGEEGGLHVLEHSEAAEDAGDLERAAEAAPAQILGREPAHFLTPHVDPP
jgi:hypothetical protein